MGAGSESLVSDPIDPNAGYLRETAVEMMPHRGLDRCPMMEIARKAVRFGRRLDGEIRP